MARSPLGPVDSNSAVYLITGISAAGKSTVAQMLAERFDRGVHVKGDVYRRMVVSGRVHMRPGAPPEAERQLDLRYRLGASTADAYFDAGFTVVVQDIVMGPALATYVERIESRPLHVIVLTHGRTSWRSVNGFVGRRPTSRTVRRSRTSMGISGPRLLVSVCGSTPPTKRRTRQWTRSSRGHLCTMSRDITLWARQESNLRRPGYDEVSARS